ncbi:unnamed protein product [Leptosia nina]|uniref:Uncharacterized protein n=1 Tax=Leptosia nina TaxID=320188 RepID=A0AAV1JNN2_9NEOP
MSEKANIVMSDGQLIQLIEALGRTSQINTEESFERLAQSFASLSTADNMQRASFVKCTARFNGVRQYEQVEEFINTISIFKKIENISDTDASDGLGLLLMGQASIWWQGVKTEADTWETALKLIRQTYAPKRQPHEIYTEIFASR